MKRIVHIGYKAFLLSFLTSSKKLVKSPSQCISIITPMSCCKLQSVQCLVLNYQEKKDFHWKR